MSNLRIIGLIIGIGGLLGTFAIYRGPKWKRSNFLFLSLFNLCLITVCINPDSVNFLRDLLSLEQSQRGRLIALLVLSNIFLMFFSFYSKSRLENLRLQFDRLVRSMGAGALEKADAFRERIEPIMVVIPAYNEAVSLKSLLGSIPQAIQGVKVGVLVVDDGSDDDTREVVGAAGHLLVSNPINRGGGAALRLGYDILKKAGGKICVTMDGDGQHRPEDMDNLVIPILEDRCDFVIGSRILGSREKDSNFRLAGVYFFGWIISILLGVKINDPSSGFRAFKMDAVDLVRLYEDQYHTSELIIEAVKKGLRISERPITILKRKYGTSKKGKDWKYGVYFAKTIINTWWRG